jgi:hypothetical protein
MPHHWKPLNPGNPDCETVVEALLERHGDGLKYVGYDEEWNVCWALIETGHADEEGAGEEVPPQAFPCERRHLRDEYPRRDGVSQD